MPALRFTVGRGREVSMRITAPPQLAKAEPRAAVAARTAVVEPSDALTPAGLEVAKQYAWSVRRGAPDKHAEREFAGTPLEYIFSKIRANTAIADFYAGA